MASVTVSSGGRYPVGTTVHAYPASGWVPSKRPPTGDPVGSSAGNAAVAADGTVTITGLADDTPYYLHADIGGDDRYTLVRTAVPAETNAAEDVTFTPGGSIAATNLQDALEEVATEAGTGGITKVTLASDASAVVGTTFADAATGLNVPVTNGVPVRFEFMVVWVADATTTGAKFGLNGPAKTRLSALYEIVVGSLAPVTSAIDAYDDEGPTLGTASDAANNLAVVRGILVPSASGSLALRVRAEVASPGAITVKAGSSVLYW